MKMASETNEASLSDGFLDRMIHELEIDLDVGQPSSEDFDWQCVEIETINPAKYSKTKEATPCRSGVYQVDDSLIHNCSEKQIGKRKLSEVCS